MGTERQAELPFGFTVQAVRYRYGQGHIDPPEWRVYLPHQCQTWDIAGEDPTYGASHEEAIADLEKFIAEAQQALAALRAGQEFGDPD